MIKSFILSLLTLVPNHELNKNPDLLTEVTGYFEAAGIQYDLPPAMLVYWAYKESSLAHTAVGKIPNRFGVILGERGYCQAHGKARKLCEAAGYDVTTRRGGIFCIAHLMREGERVCGSLDKGLVWYASGGCRGTERTRKKMRDRQKVWKRRWNKTQRISR